MGLMSGINIEKLDFEGIGKGVADITGGIGKLFKDIRATITGKEITDPNKLIELESQMVQIESNMMSLQTNVNAIEASSSKLFVAGWRPYIGWILGTAMGIYFIPMFSIGTFLWAREVILSGKFVSPPDLGIGQVIGLVASMLGMAALRTVEKAKDVQNNH